MEDDKSLERQKRVIKEEVEALEDASGISRERMLENKVTAFNESMSQLKSERHGLLKQRAQLTQELERRGFSARDESQATTTSSDVSKKKFAARENLISRLIQDSRSSQMLVDRLKNGESFTDAKKHVKMEERREAERREREREREKREKEAREVEEAKRRSHDARKEGAKGARAETSRTSKLRPTSIRSKRQQSEESQIMEVPAYVQDLQAQIRALQASLASKAKEERTREERAARPVQVEQVEIDADLPKPIQKDSEMIKLHQSHMRDMLKLQYEIERVQREVELEKIKTEISKLRDEKEQHLGKKGGQSGDVLSRMSSLHGNRRDEQENLGGFREPAGKQKVEVEVLREEPANAFISRRVSPAMSPMTMVPSVPPPQADTYTITIQMDRMTTTNFMLQGKVRVVAQFYDGIQLQNEALTPGPAQDSIAAGDGEMASTPYVFPVYSEATSANFFTWRDKMIISGVQVNSASQVVLDLQTILEVEKDDEDGNGEEGWNRLKKLYGKNMSLNLPQVVGWALVPLIDSETNQLIQGHQTVPVYRLPKILSASPGKKYPMEDTSLELKVSITKEKVGKARAQSVTNLERRRSLEGAASLGTTPAKASRGSPMKRTSKSLDASGIPPEAWVRSRHALKSLETFQPGDGFVIRVDAGRFFPENVTVTKITVRFLTSEREQVGDSIESIGSLDNSAYFPRYRLRCYVNTEQWDDPTIMALITVETLERDSEEFCVVGYACLPIFLNPDTEKQPKTDHMGDFILRSGSYQIPLHNCLPPQEVSARAFSKEMDRNKSDLQNTKVSTSAFDEEAFHEHCPRISCASLLVRVLTAEEDDLVMLRGDRLPEYASREYDTRQTEPIGCEKLMYPFKLKTRSFLSTGELLKKSFFTEDEVEAIEEDDREGSGTLLMEWVEGRLKRPDLRNDVMLNYGHSFTYLDKLGFSVAVDGARNLVKGLPAFAFVSLNPPGVFYETSGRNAGVANVTEDVAFTFRHDPKSKSVCPDWEDGLIRFPFVPYDPCLCVIIEVRYLNVKSSRLTTLGWTALPVFYKSQDNEQHVCTGCYNLPLFMGSPPFSFLESMWTTHFTELAKTGLDQARLRISKEAPSVLVRLVDNQREGEMQDAATDPRMKSKVKIPHFVPSKYASAMGKETRGRKVYEKLKPKKVETFVEWRAQMAEQVSQASGVAYAKEDLEAEVEEEKNKLADATATSAAATPAKTVSRVSSRQPSRAPSRAGDPVGEAGSAASDDLSELEEESEYEDDDEESEVE